MGSADTFSPVEAARLLRLSEKRVRQLADAGRLEVAGRSPLRLTQQSVHQLRAERRDTGAASSTRRSRAPAAAAVDVEAVVTRTVEALLPRALESADAAQRRLEATLLEQLAAERARVVELEAQLRGRRRWWARR